MNYRHIYHAGNFADVMKHLALSLVIDHLKKKDTPFCVIDAHGGLGLYDLQSETAQKTREWEDGIGRFEGGGPYGGDFQLYFDLVKNDLAKGIYPGSPTLISRLLRPGDRLIANELHPDDLEALRYNLRGQADTVVTGLDAYECIRAHIPPAEKRGLVMIDPPFEKKDEFETLIRQMKEWKKRFPNGVYLLWYPIKAHLSVDAMKQAARDLALPRTWCVETIIHPRSRGDVLNGCGLLLFNAPYQVPQRYEALLPLLSQKMGLVETPSVWLTPP